MAEDAAWISTCIGEAYKANQAVAENVLKSFEKCLKAELRERYLSQKELAEVAKILLAANVPVPPEAEAQK
jgi:lipoate-protein ligase A